ncbi:MAG: SMC-Scp complex subunit ScpB [Leptolyngbya sp. Prado105]|nr:SMC-Scp complex subunit ScpB [Leptolyngbya sp. Prado105]
MTRLTTTLEAILYLKAQPMTIAQLAELAGFDRKTTEEGLMELMSEYAHRDGALEIAETESGYSLQLRETYQNLINALIPADIGVGALRTLAVIALKGPLSQTELVEIRGSGVYQHIPELVELGFVRKRKNSDGRSSLVQVTDKFHQYFQINQDIGQLIQKKPKAEETVEEPGSELIATESSEEVLVIAEESTFVETIADR